MFALIRALFFAWKMRKYVKELPIDEIKAVRKTVDKYFKRPYPMD